MADQPTTAPQPQPPPQVQQNDDNNGNNNPGRNWGEIFRTVVLQLVVFYFLTSMWKQNSSNNSSTTSPSATTDSSPKIGGAVPNILRANEGFSLTVWVANSTQRLEFDTPPLWTLNSLHYDDYTSGPTQDGVYTFRTQIDVPDGFENGNPENSTGIYLHMLLLKNDCEMYPTLDVDLERRAVSKSHALPPPNPYCHIYSVSRIDRRLPAPSATATRRLLGAKDGLRDDGESKTTNPTITPDSQQIISWWHENVTVALFSYTGVLAQSGLPPQLVARLEFLPMNYKPELFVSTFWDLKNNMYPINSSTPVLPLNLEFRPLGLLRWQMYHQMEESWRVQRDWGSSDENMQEELRRMLLETNVYYLALTMTVTLLHTVLDCCAFKNEIQFWRARKSSKGLSTRSIFISIVAQAIILLYLFDNSTSTLILCSCGLGILIDLWKVTKACKVTLVWTDSGMPWVKIEDKADYASTTKAYDEMATKYLMWALLPLFTAYGIYSLVYEEHKSWYSYVVGILAGGVYTFGFIMMTPQLFINYKLKSVAHMPWRMLFYRFLTTIIDDLFAFIIKMPTMHRLACFRDDVIFLIFLYQRWCYPVDKSRRTDLSGDEAENEPASPTKPAPPTDSPADSAPLSENGNHTPPSSTDSNAQLRQRVVAQPSTQ